MTTNATSAPFQSDGKSPRLLITAGPTHEPIDAVRFIGNRSSGRMGIALAHAAGDAGWDTTLLLGPGCLEPPESVTTHRFVSTADLEQELDTRFTGCDILIMAAAVSDYRPRTPSPASKIRRSETEGLTIKLDPTPDLLAGCCKRARGDQLMVGFALEPSDRLIGTARDKLERKGTDLIVANPLGTMESGEIEAVLIASRVLQDFEQSSGKAQTKNAFATWLLPILADAWRAKKRIKEARES